MTFSARSWLSTAFPARALGPAFLKVQIGGFLLLLAGELERLAVAWWCLEKTGSTALFASMVTLGSVGYLVAQPALGWLGDRFPRRNVLLAAFGISAVCALTLAMLSRGDHFPVLAVGTVLLTGAMATATVPALMSAVVADLVDKSKATDAFRVRASFGSVASIGGPIAAGAAIAFVGYHHVLLGACLLVALALALLAAGLPSRSTTPAGAKAGPIQFVRQWWSMTSYGAKAAWTIRPERDMGLLAMLTNAATLPLVLVVVPALVKQHFDDPAWVSGLASASMGAGVLMCSTYVMPKVKDRWTHDAQIVLGRLLTAVGVLAAFLAVLAFDVQSLHQVSKGLLCLSLLCAGVGLGLVNIVGSSVRSRAIPAHLRTRIFAATGFLSGLGIPLGMLLQGAALSSIGPKWAVFLVALAMWASVAVYLASSSIRSVMRLRPEALDGEYARRYPQFETEGASGAGAK
jgi:DHA3 family macrolide efflux protein-like MFS transporter